MEIIRNTTSHSAREIIEMAKTHDEVFTAAGLPAPKGRVAYAILDGRFVQGGEIYNAAIVIDYYDAETFPRPGHGIQGEPETAGVVADA